MSLSREKTFAALPATTRGQFIVINGDPKGNNFLYCNGSQIFIRNLKDTSICDIYTEHTKETTVAKYSPSGFYIASADKGGIVRVWDTVNPEHILKKEHPVINGPIRDLDWTFDNSKLCAVGDGREMFGRIFTYDSGNSVGEIMGHSKSINNCAFKPTRPMRLATVGEDFNTVFFEGPPFKFKVSKSDHTNFANCVRYSPDGNVFVTGGADGKIFIYDGKTSESIGELVDSEKAHGGGVYAVSFSKDSKKLLSVSGDKTAKIWDMETKGLETKFVMGTGIADMQVGCLWQDDNILTVSLSGHINFLNPSEPTLPFKIIKGHNKPITTATRSEDGSRIFTASSDGSIVSWDTATGDCEVFHGKGHSNQVNGIVLDGETLISVGMDDTIRYSSPITLEYGESFKLDSQPKAVDSKNGLSVIACNKHIIVMKVPGNKLSSLSTNFEALSVSIHPNMAEVAIGTRSSLIIFALSNDGILTESNKIAANNDVSTVAYSPDGQSLAASYGKKVVWFETASWEEQLGGWGDQPTAKVISLSWAPDSSRFLTGSVDAHIIVWPRKKSTGNRPSVKAHPKSFVNQVMWLTNETVATAGQDSNIKIWKISQ